MGGTVTLGSALASWGPVLALGLWLGLQLSGRTIRVARSIARDAEEEARAYRDLNAYLLSALGDEPAMVERRAAIRSWYTEHKGA